MNPASFVAEALDVGVSLVLRRATGEIVPHFMMTVRKPEGRGYDQVPPHPGADALLSRFDALDDQELGALRGYLNRVVG